MDIGLTAKVEPEVDERAADKEAGRLREKMDSAVEGLEATADMDSVMYRLEDAKETAQDITVDGGDAPSFENIEPTGFDVGRFGVDEIPSPVMSGQGQSVLDMPDSPETVNDSDSTDSMSPGALDRAEPLLQTAANTRSISGALSQLGNMFMKKGGLMILGGLGLVLLSRIASAAVNASPLLGQVIDMFGLAMKLFFRPFGNIIGQALMPIAGALLELAYQFNTIFSNQGFFAAFAWLGSYLVQNLAEGTVSFLGGSDNEFGIADAISTAFRTAALFSFIKMLLKSSLTDALSGIAGKGLLSAIRSAIPNLGVSSYLSRLLPSIGTKQILKRIGLGGLVKILGSKGLTYLIPVVGQVIGAIDLLTMAITALIPGMEMFSPLTYLLMESFGLLMWAVTGTMSALGDFWGWLKSLAPDINLSKMLQGMLPSISVFGLISGMFAFANSSGMSASMLLDHLFSFAQLGIDKIFGSLPDLSGGIGGMGMVRGVLDTVVSVLSGGFSSVQSLLMSISGILSFVSISELPQLVSFVTALVGLVLALVEWVFDTLDSFVSKVVGWIEGAGDIFSGGVDFVGDILEGTVDFVDDILGGTASLGRNLVSSSQDTATDIGSSVTSMGSSVVGGTIDVVQDLFGGTVNLVKDLFGGGINLVQDLFNGAVNIVQDVFNGGVDIVQDVFNGTVDVVKDLFNGTVSVVQDVFQGTVNVVQELFAGGINIAQDLFAGGVNIAQDLFEGGVNIVQDMFVEVVDIADQLFVEVVDIVSQLFERTVNVVQDIFGGAYRSTKTFLLDLFGGVFVSLGQFIASLFGGTIDIVKDLFGGGFSAVVSFVKTLFGGVISQPINVVKEIVPDTPSPGDIVDHVFPGDVLSDGGGGFIDWFEKNFAEGGVVTSPTRALIGEGGEPEYVVPESKLGGFVSNVMSGESGDSAVPGPTAFAEGGVVDSPTRALIGEDGETEYVVPESKLHAFTANVLSGETGSNLLSDSRRSVVGDTISSSSVGDTVSNLIAGDSVSSSMVSEGEETANMATVFGDGGIVNSVRESVENRVSESTVFSRGGDVSDSLSAVSQESLVDNSVALREQNSVSSLATGDEISNSIAGNTISSSTAFGDTVSGSTTDNTISSLIKRKFISSPTEFVGGDVVSSVLSRVVSESNDRESVMSESNLTESVLSVIQSGSRSGLESESSVTDLSEPQLSPSVSVGSVLSSVGLESPSVGVSVDMMSRDSPTAFAEGSVIPSPTAFAEGGVVTGPTRAMIGEGGESEAVVPFSKVDTFVQSAMAESSLDFGPQPQSSPSVDPSVSVDVEGDIDADEIASAIGRELSSDFDELSREIQTVANEVSNMDIGSITITADGKVLAEVTNDGEDKYRRNRQVTR